jgi:hypothetical protein
VKLKIVRNVNFTYGLQGNASVSVVTRTCTLILPVIGLKG